MGSDLELVGEHEKVQFEQSTELGGTERRIGEKDEVASACLTDPVALCLHSKELAKTSK